ncbi:MAG: hypothetical protein MJZ66_07795 [Bacteroidales bacterium]|nr:hypothetical protein [Bacteroidales bacterium]MCQ2253828.1 hypothetical protein [Bacteroidales bacterium]
MKNTISRLFFVLILAITAAGCINDAGGRVISEGVITYNMNYPTDTTLNIDRSLIERNRKSALVSVFPSSIKLYFKDNNTAMVINGWAGAFSFRYINNYEEGKIHTLFRVLDKLDYCTDSSSMQFGYREMTDMKISYTQDTMTIAGYLCKKAVAEGQNIKTDVWYTNNIKIKNANTGNPFKNLDGVPLKFNVLLSGFYMEIEADHVEMHNKDNKVVPDDIFTVPSDYKSVTEQDLQELLTTFQRRNH